METGVAVAVLCVPVLGVAAQWLAWRLQVPAIVLLFAAGLLIGPGLQVLHPSQDFPPLKPLVGLAVAIIVFEGGLALDFRELRASGEGVLRLTTLALPCNFLLGTVAAHWIGGLGWSAAALFGAIVVVTGPTVVLPLLRHARLEPRAAAFLKWEAIVNDPVGAMLATILLQLLLAGGGTGSIHPWGELALWLAASLVLATALGVGAGYLVRWSFVHDQVPEVMKVPILLAIALGVYALSNLVMHEAGLLAATVFGVAVANLHIPGAGELRRFKEALVVLLVATLFITLTADLDRAVLFQLDWRLLGLTGAMLVLVRPTAILLATWRSSLTKQERALCAWIAPRGIVAAAVAGIAGLQLQGAGYVGADRIMPAVFALIAATVVLHGFSLRPLANRLGLALGTAPALGIVGASPWAIDLASALDELEVPVVLFDTFPGALTKVRERGLSAIQAEILSQHGEEELSRHAVDYLLAATPDVIYNGLVCARLGPELGRQRVFQLAPPGGRLDDRRDLGRDSRGLVFGSAKLDYDAYERLHETGWRFTSDPSRDAVPLIFVRQGGGLVVATPEHEQELPTDEEDRTLYFAPPPDSGDTLPA